MATLESEIDQTPSPIPPDFPRGVKLLHDPIRNKGTAFTEPERDLLNLRGLLPPRVHTLDQQVRRVMEQLAAKSSDLSRYIYLVSLQDRNEMLFYRVVTTHLRELMPIVYTPTVGEACQRFGHIFRRPRGVYISAHDRGRMDEILNNWPHEDVRIIVVTDGERILGLGDLGAAGMGIPIGKLVLYSACAGIHPTKCLPVTLDVGTNNPDLLRDPLYIGLQEERLRGTSFDEMVDEFVQTVHKRFPHSVIQLEDFANRNAFRLLRRYRDDYCIFDDDIQGTGAVALSGLIASARLIGKPLNEHRILFLGAGEAGIGIADIVCTALRDAGLTDREARERCWFFDSKGLVVAGRQPLAEHKTAYAHQHEAITDFTEAVQALKPTALIGVSGTPRTFTEPALRAMADTNERPIIFALSNPTSKSECTARQAYEWTGGRCVFASGSPFDSVDVHGRVFVPGQANNAYIFPGVGLGAITSETGVITDDMFYVAANALANEVSERDLALGRVYPSLTRIREVSAHIATAVATLAYDTGVAGKSRPADVMADVQAHMFEPRYPRYA